MRNMLPPLILGGNKSAGVSPPSSSLSSGEENGSPHNQPPPLPPQPGLFSEDALANVYDSPSGLRPAGQP